MKLIWTMLRVGVAKVFGGFWPKAALVGVVLALTVIGVLRTENAHLRRQRWEAQLARINAEARADTTRWVYGDSLRVVERMLVQEAIARDEIDRALRRETRAKASLRVQLDSMNLTATAPVIEDSAAGIRTAEFDLVSEVLTAKAHVVLPPPPAPGQMDLHIRFEPIHLGVRIQCQEASAARPRSGAVAVTAPQWAKITLDEVTAEPDVCSPPLERKKGGNTLFGVLLGAVGAVGAILLLPF